MTTHDETGPRAEHEQHAGVLVTVEEARRAFAQLGGSTAGAPGIAQLLRTIIAGGRSTRLVLEDPAMRARSLRQYASLPQLEAAVRRHVHAGAACFGDPDCPVYSTRRRPPADRDHAGAGLPCDVCGPRCTIDDPAPAGD